MFRGTRGRTGGAAAVRSSLSTTRSILEAILVLGFLASTIHLSNAQFAAVDRRALLQGAGRHDTASFTERHFHLEEDYAALDLSPPWPPLNFDRRRQVDTVAQCGTESHSCLSVGSLGADKCCKNSQYCFILRNWTVGCCSVGNDCADATPCKEGYFYQNTTISVTTIVTNIVTLGPSDDPTATRTSTAQLITASVVPGCGSNPCSRSSFLCQSAFGGQCCGYGSICGSNNLCIAPVTASASEVVSLIPPECSAATEFACVPGNKTAGCCDRGQLCVGDNFCSGMLSLPTGTNATIEANTELSSQAKAGIGAGVAVGAALLIGLLTWFCVRRRREAKIAASRRQSTATGSHVPPTGNPRNNPYAVPLGGRRGLGGRTASGTVSPDMYSGGAGGGRREHTMSEISGPTSGGMSGGNRPPLHQSGLVYDYFGPDAVPGPYTDHEPDTSPYNYLYDDEGKIIPGTGVAATATGSGGQGGAGVDRTLSRGVPAVPRGPADISRPVEIGESVSGYTQKRGVRRIEGDPPSYSTTPEAVDGISPPPHPPQGSPNADGMAGVGRGEQALGGTTIVTHSGTSPVPPPGSDTMIGGARGHGGGAVAGRGLYDPHHVEIHEMDPQRVGPFELGGPHGNAVDGSTAPTAANAASHGGGENTSALPTAAAAGHSSGSGVGTGVSATGGPLRSYEDEEAAEQTQRGRSHWRG